MHIRFPSIKQFKNVIQHVKHTERFRGLDSDGNPIYDTMASLPTLTFEGTIKLHGTNAAVVIRGDDTYCQSRERVLSVGDDNHGFTTFIESRDLYSDFMEVIRKNGFDSDTVVFYGEWCGQGIQSGVAISDLSKRFVIFSIRVGDEEEAEWYSPADLEWDELKLKAKGCYLIDAFKTYTVKIDFNQPELIQNTLIEITNAVEEKCPVGDAFGVSGVGEGVVWKCVDEKFTYPELWFKVKGEKHSVSKVKSLAPVDIEKVQSIKEFVERVVTDNRLEQGISYLKEMGKEISQKSTGDFIRWVYNDVMKEEKDVFFASGLDSKDVGKYISDPVRRWYFSYLNKL